MRRPLLAANWKMNKTIGEAVELAEAVVAGFDDPTDREIVICPPFTALHALLPVVRGTPVKLGAQNVYLGASGAFTGEISAPMLQDLECQYVIVGHSERRQFFGEDDALITSKVRNVIEYGLRPILCVGETKAQRDAGEADAVVLGQLRAAIGGLTAHQVANLVIAYEPVWAIGTGAVASTEDAEAMHAAIRAAVHDACGTESANALRILYGGSVKPDNVDALMHEPDIDGALVGGASLNAASFLQLVHFKH